MRITNGFKIVRRQVDGRIKAAAMKDEPGRVLVVISDRLPLPQVGFYTVWGIYKYIRFKFSGAAKEAVETARALRAGDTTR